MSLAVTEGVTVDVAPSAVAGAGSLADAGAACQWIPDGSGFREPIPGAVQLSCTDTPVPDDSGVRIRTSLDIPGNYWCVVSTLFPVGIVYWSRSDGVMSGPGDIRLLWESRSLLCTTAALEGIMCPSQAREVSFSSGDAR